MPATKNQRIELKLRDYVVSVLVGTIVGSIQLAIIMENKIESVLDLPGIKLIDVSSAAFFVLVGLVFGFPAMLILALPGCIIAWLLLKNQHVATFWIPMMVGVAVTASAFVVLLLIFNTDVLDELPLVLMGSLQFALLPGAIAGLVYRACYLRRLR